MIVPGFEDILAAAERISGHAVRTPLLRSPVLDERVGGVVLLKAENLQRTGSFKFRGAYNKISQAPLETPAIVAFSSGNHAQGAAAAAAMRGLPSTIVMPADAPRMKKLRVVALGGKVVEYDREREDRDAIARRIVAETGGLLVPPFDDPQIIAGQGTAGLELADDALAQGLPPDQVLVNCSGGGLAAGVALAVKTRVPDARVYTTEPAGFDDMARSLDTGERVRNVQVTGSVQDALLAPTPGELTFSMNRGLLSGGFAVTDEEALAAVAFAFRELKLVLEPGGAASLAAVLTGKIETRGRTTAILLSGGNIDAEMMARALAL